MTKPTAQSGIHSSRVKPYKRPSSPFDHSQFIKAIEDEDDYQLAQYQHDLQTLIIKASSNCYETSTTKDISKWLGISYNVYNRGTIKKGNAHKRTFTRPSLTRLAHMQLMLHTLTHSH